ncbi:unnamed protein product [Schistosoma mattheei]|uniref:Uncharacterized protein n=1 Tax=Schistosoma mattheei TaxID=31246 RepID=A0AA85ARP4_9TREM|nr:unnamed protein product [Schistosoma mattheei]
MSIVLTIYSGAFMKSLQPFAIRDTERYSQRHHGGWQYALKRMNINQMRITEFLTSNWSSFEIYRHNRSRYKKKKLVEILYAENSMLYEKYNVE